MSKAPRRLPGGITPEQHKERSLRVPIRQAPLPSRLVIPVTQYGLSEARVLVLPGEHVLKGQCIARGTQDLGIACHASSSGTVEAVDERLVPNASGLPELCVSIACDGEDRRLARTGVPDYRALDRTELLNLIAE